ncbi:MAG: thiamine phosphate synthase [Hydrogenophaga sp.]|uniref:thiamine phosphate synthase n=1 Tax=Hydrogenophaga sp. TaxID=1904254 RepID=UPI0025BB54B1|nr:thiamine phosphate synthase [Hydrogenophaga sp.]MDO9505188.1 thiamine phosphate synthase [Hydrogenophaga sp.]MDP2987132.1 thiamine phosphate synthase [Hydrogenophaga sp.]MDP3204844.1 thiamine phosphate synthase [Hydrogenophaga sp.]MDP3628428.1 thiamine phosphate synthase [Hydrogenophaga sp.]
MIVTRNAELNQSMNVQSMAQSIVRAHQATLALPLVPGAQPLKGDAGDMVFAAALQAAHLLGFVPADALCLAQAWSQQSLRTGEFHPEQWPTEAVDFGMAPWPRQHAFASCPQALGLYAVMPDAAWTIRMARAGVPTVQLRFKSGDASAVRAEVMATVAGVQGTGARLFINDHWQLAIEAGAYGVHLGQEDLQAMTPAGLKAIKDAGLRLGLSTHGYAEMLIADQHSPSYIAMGAVFPTTLKQMATAPQGTGRLAMYAKLLCDYPRVAIGGIDLASLPAVLGSGVGSVGVVRALMGAADPEAEVAVWQAALPQN